MTATLPQRMVRLLQALVSTPSPSRHEDATAGLLADWLASYGATPYRLHNNVWALAGDAYDPGRPTLMLNSHHDTVKAAPTYTRAPLSADIDAGRLYGLGSNDAGGSVATLAETFVRLSHTPLPFNLLLALTAEEEVGGENGIRALLPHLAHRGIGIDAAIVGEPTGMQPAIGERGLVVLDAVTPGVTGHAARGEGVNAIYRAMADIDAVRGYRFAHQSAVLGPIGINVTQIEAGWQHNAIPDTCRWVADIRTTDAYTNEQVARMLQDAVQWTTLTPRSTRVRASVIGTDHPLVRGAVALGLEPFVSPTTSDMSLMHGIHSLKIGPGQSARSHRADEYILLDELQQALGIYHTLIQSLTL